MKPRPDKTAPAAQTAPVPRGKPANPRARADHYTLRAKAEGYPARSVYKLEEIQARFQPIPPGAAVLDAGAAPGSWSLFVLRRAGPAPRLTAVDLRPLTIPLPPGALFLQGDLLAPETRAALAERAPFDVILSDAAPDTTGSRAVDAPRSAALAEAVLDLCPGLLRPGGAAVIKIFQGGPERDLLARLRQTFAAARMFKPRACRSDSFETYLIGLGWQTPG